MIRIIFLCSLIVVSALAIESNFHREDGCTNARGYCVLESECPQAVTYAHKNLCPGQKNDGAVCCPNFPETEVNCHQLHNVCTDRRCPKQLNLGRKGCPAGQNCCVLL